MADWEEEVHPPRYNPVTRHAFRRQVWLQIFLPLVLGILGVAVVAYLLAQRSVAAPSAWADASLILLLLPVLVVALLPIVLFAGLAYLAGLLIQRIPDPASRAQDALAEVARQARQAGAVAVRPMIVTQSFLAALARAIRRLAAVVDFKDEG
jgi:hypothetical protein